MDFENILLGVFETAGDIDWAIAAKILGGVFVFFWLMIVFWVFQDTKNRTKNIFVRIILPLIVLILNILGLIIYFIVRPSRTLEEKHWEELEKKYLTYQTQDLVDCPNCGKPLYPGCNFCPDCGYAMQVECSKCGVLVDRTMNFCPNCGEQLIESARIEEGKKAEIPVKVHLEKPKKAEKKNKFMPKEFFAGLGNKISTVCGNFIKSVKNFFAKVPKIKVPKIQIKKSQSTAKSISINKKSKKKSSKKSKRRK